MKQILNNATQEPFSAHRDAAIEKRIFRTMALACALMVIASVAFANWRVTAGLLLGGLLSLLNHRWLSNSTSAAFSVLVDGRKPRLKLAQYVLRYAVIGAAVFAAYKLNIVSLTATIAGLCTFVVALFVEAFRALYLAIIHREEVI